MTDPTNPFAAMFAQMQDQMQDMAKTFPAMGTFDAKAMADMWPTMPSEMMETMFGDRLNEGGLDARTRLLLTLGALVMQGAQNEVAVRHTVRHAIAAGATPQHISETIAQMSVFAGLPAVAKAMEIAGDEMKEDDKT